MTAASPPLAPAEKGTVTRACWIVCALLFFATTINYLDRQLFSLLVPFFEDELHLGPTDLALINVSFLLAYGFGMMFVGRWIDRVGTRIGLGVSFLSGTSPRSRTRSWAASAASARSPRCTARGRSSARAPCSTRPRPRRASRPARASSSPPRWTSRR